MDSLMGVEIQQVLEKQHNIVMSIEQIRNLTINNVKEMATSKVNSQLDSSNEKYEQNDYNEYIYGYNMECLIPEHVCVKINDGDESKKIFLVHPLVGKMSVENLQYLNKIKKMGYGV